MSTFNTIENWALHAYADGELDGAEKAAIEKLLAENTEARAALDAWQSQNRAMRLAFDSVLSEPVPAPLTALLRPRRGRIPFAAMAASVALLALGTAAGWTLRPAKSFTIADRALAAHEIYAPELRHPVEVTASEEDHLQHWLSKRLGTRFSVPDLSDQGYTLLGGRLLAAEDRPAAQLMYEDANTRRITVFLVSNPARSEAAMEIAQRGNLTACYWYDAGLGVAVAGEMDRDAAQALAKAVYGQEESS
jgi:anti-sigma factor RsiW